VVNRKRVERLWRLEGHRVPPRRRASGKKAQGAATNAPVTWRPRVRTTSGPTTFSARTENGAPIRILNVVDEYRDLHSGRG
jgi:hypothetical protein